MSDLTKQQREALSEKIDHVSRRSLDGSVVMSAQEWNEIVDLVEEQLRQSQPVPQWQPIETAPRDESVVLVAAWTPCLLDATARRPTAEEHEVTVTEVEAVETEDKHAS